MGVITFWLLFFSTQLHLCATGVEWCTGVQCIQVAANGTEYCSCVEAHSKCHNCIVTMKLLTDGFYCIHSALSPNLGSGCLGYRWIPPHSPFWGHSQHSYRGKRGRGHSAAPQLLWWGPVRPLPRRSVHPARDVAELRHQPDGLPCSRDLRSRDGTLHLQWLWRSHEVWRILIYLCGMVWWDLGSVLLYFSIFL